MRKTWWLVVGIILLVCAVLALIGSASKLGSFGVANWIGYLFALAVFVAGGLWLIFKWVKADK